MTLYPQPVHKGVLKESSYDDVRRKGDMSSSKTNTPKTGSVDSMTNARDMEMTPPPNSKF